MLNELIEQLEEDISIKSEYEDQDARAWRYEEGILISVNQAKLILKILKDLGN